MIDMKRLKSRTVTSSRPGNKTRETDETELRARTQTSEGTPPNVSLETQKLAYSVEEVAELISLGRTKVVALVSAGEIASIKIGGRRLVPRQDLHDFVERLRAESLAEAV